jgi:hypothetical protein
VRRVVCAGRLGCLICGAFGGEAGGASLGAGAESGAEGVCFGVGEGSGVGVSVMRRALPHVGGELVIGAQAADFGAQLRKGGAGVMLAVAPVAAPVLAPEGAQVVERVAGGGEDANGLCHLTALVAGECGRLPADQPADGVEQTLMRCGG